MRTPRSFYATLFIFFTFAAAAQSPQKPDAATAAWWAQTVALSNDSMEGRDTGTDAYERAAKYVAAQFTAAGLKPAGDNGTFFQRVPMHQTELDLKRSYLTINFHDAKRPSVPLKLVEEITLTPRAFHATADFISNMIFLGYGDTLPDPHTLDLKDFRDSIAVVFNATPANLTPSERATFAAGRTRNLINAGFFAIISIDNPSATEPFHWPAAYARSVVIGDGHSGTTETERVTYQFRISADAAAKLFSANPDHPYSALLHDAESGASLPTFTLAASLSGKLSASEKDISSPNILAILPGSDPKLAPEFVALSAHLDGYGYGTPVLGDNLYNGALDDAAYVATLIELAKDLQHKAPARSLLICIFTGEEKGLLGSAWFTAHPTVPPASIVADLNLDQLRPIFPLNILTMEGLNDSTLGETVRTVAAKFNIQIRPDLEPERNLFRRADNYNFVRIGVPIASFIFGYDKGSPEEATYRDWYARRYHKPQDDLNTPIDWTAADKFNRLYTALTLAIANDAQRPHWLPSSPYAPPHE
jgi:hypothetical protein